MKTKVFVSSTYTDLKSYRDKVRKVLENLEIILIGMKGFVFIRNK
ncbi:MAG: hypothetical protein DRJ10_01895 [Bacteroidetes bacterium]|nr:MAG: hypothetical protein DRI74_08885 [Bacteroidota bacterium]RLD84161.1 MAG: hypothetical protein DRJ10_01895 [Bacteroidota bacterium]